LEKDVVRSKVITVWKILSRKIIVSRNEEERVGDLQLKIFDCGLEEESIVPPNARKE
jgi:hypothetical protein